MKFIPIAILMLAVPAMASVTVSSPKPNSTTTSPVHYVATASSSCAKGVGSMGIYVNNKLVYSSHGASRIDTQLSLPAGAEHTVVQEWDKCGKSTYVTINLTILGNRAAVPPSKHVVLIMEENKSYSTVVGDTNAWPNLNHLIHIGSLPTNYYADTHPSIGNYFMLTTGQILTNNDNSNAVWNVDNLARRMLAHGVSFRIYAEGIKQGYLGGNTGLYALRHNPFARLKDIAGSPTVANRVLWPFTQFAKDVASGKLPEFSYIVPDLDDDAHNGSPQQADAWLQSQVLDKLFSATPFEPGGDGLLIVDFDEASTSDSRHGGGQVSPVLWGPNVRAGYRQASRTVYQHQSVLRTVMESLQLASPMGAASSAPDMTEFFTK